MEYFYIIECPGSSSDSCLWTLRAYALLFMWHLRKKSQKNRLGFLIKTWGSDLIEFNCPLPSHFTTYCQDPWTSPKPRLLKSSLIMYLNERQAHNQRHFPAGPHVVSAKVLLLLRASLSVLLDPWRLSAATFPHFSTHECMRI